MKIVFVSCFTVLAALVLTVAAMEPPNGYDCKKIKKLLIPCLNYVTNKSASPTLLCCKGVSVAKALLKTKGEGRAACKCIKEGARHIPEMNYDRVKALPMLCHVDAGFPYSKGFNCDRFH